jgi:hypothetical protein
MKVHTYFESVLSRKKLTVTHTALQHDKHIGTRECQRQYELAKTLHMK